MNKGIVTAVVVGVVALGAGFVGGMQYQKSQSPFGGRAAGQFVGAGGQRAARAGAGFAIGSVLSKDEQSVTLKLQSGSTQIVFLSASTSVLRSSAGALGDIMVGAEVTAMGTSNADGSITAQSVQMRPVGMPLPGNRRGVNANN